MSNNIASDEKPNIDDIKSIKISQKKTKPPKAGKSKTNKPASSNLISTSKHNPLNMTRYSRTKLIKILGSRDVSLESDDVDHVMEESNIDEKHKEEFIKFMNDECTKGQANVTRDMGSTEPFNTLDEWAKFVQEGSGNEHGGQEFAVLMKLIALTEQHPDPKTCGVDFESLYMYIGDLMMGRPVAELQYKTKFFLEEVFEEIQEELRPHIKKRLMNEIQKNTYRSPMWGVEAQDHSDASNSENPLIWNKGMNPLQFKDDTLKKITNNISNIN